MPQRINAPMRQCCAFAMCQCMNVSMFRCQCFNVQTTNARNAAIAIWIERSVSFPYSPLLNVALTQCCWRPAPSPMYPPGPNTQYLVICIYHIFSPLHQFHCCWFHVPCLLPLVSRISCFLCFLFLVLTWLVLCLCISCPQALVSSHRFRVACALSHVPPAAPVPSH